MKRTILTVLAAALMVASTAQIASAAERHHARKMVRAPVSDQFRNANDAVARPAQSGSYSDYTDGHAISAPAGR
jgi:Ni/Co efflux regulator RcnB